MKYANCVIEMGIRYTDGKYEVVVSDDEGRNEVRVCQHGTIASAKSFLAYYAKQIGLVLTHEGCEAKATDGRTVKADGTFRKYNHRIFF